MTPYKGYLIETYTRTNKTPNGFGGFVESQSWETRFIDGTTGQVRLAKDDYDAKTQIDALTDPSGKAKEREYLARLIHSLAIEIELCKEGVKELEDKLTHLEQHRARLKEEYKAAGGSDE